MPTLNDFSLLFFFLGAMLTNTEPQILRTNSAFLGQYKRYSTARPSSCEASLAFPFRSLALRPLSELSLVSFLLGAILRKTVPVVFRTTKAFSCQDWMTLRYSGFLLESRLDIYRLSQPLLWSGAQRWTSPSERTLFGFFPPWCNSEEDKSVSASVQRRH